MSDSRSLRPTLLWMRDQGADLIKVIHTLGLFATVAAFYRAYWLVVLLMRALAGGGLALRGCPVGKNTAQAADAAAGRWCPDAVAVCRRDVIDGDTVRLRGLTFALSGSIPRRQVGNPAVPRNANLAMPPRLAFKA